MSDTQFDIEMGVGETDKRQQVFENIDNVIAYLYRIKAVLTQSSNYETLTRHMELQNRLLTRRMENDKDVFHVAKWRLVLHLNNMLMHNLIFESDIDIVLNNLNNISI